MKKVLHTVTRWALSAGIVLSGLTLLLSVTAAAGAAQSSFTVRSQYQSPIADTWNQTIDWTFSWETATQLTVSRPSDQNPMIRMQFRPDGRLVQVQTRLRLASDDRTLLQNPSRGIILSRGHAAPYDFLAPHDRTSGPLTITQTIAGSDFADTFMRTVEWITVGDLAASIIDGSNLLKNLSLSAPLMRIALKKGDTLVVEQLWHEGDGWWLY